MKVVNHSQYIAFDRAAMIKEQPELFLEFEYLILQS